MEIKMKDKKYVEFWLEKPEESPGFLIWQITNLWQRKMNTALKNVDLTHVQFVLLAGVAWLERFKDPITQIKLAKHAKTNIMMTSKVIRTLEKKKLIIREECKNDTRAKCILLTNEGYQKVQNAIDIVQEVDKEFFKDMENNAGFIENLGYILKLNDGER